MDKNSEHVENKSFEKFVNWLEKSINPEVDPCEDFFGYACGNFNEDNYQYTRGEYSPPQYGDPFKRMLDNETIVNPLIQKVRNFYSSLPTDTRIIMQNEEVINFCGGFPALNNNWRSENFDWIKAAAILSAFDVDTILYSSVDYLDDRKVISVFNYYHREEMYRAEEILKKAGISEESCWDIINDVNIIYEKLNNISNRLSIDIDDIDDMLDHPVIKTFAELNEDEFYYQEYFESFLGHPLHDDDIFHLHYEEPGYLERYFNIFLETSPKTVANYITFQALCYEVSQRNNWRLYFCKKHFIPVLLSLGFSRFWNQSEAEKRANVLEIFKSSFNNFSEETSIDPSDYSEILTNRDKAILDYINAFFQVQQIEKEYGDLEISPDNFFQNITNLGSREVPTSLKKCYSHRFQEQEMYYDSKNLFEFYFHHLDKPMVYYFSGWDAENWARVFAGMRIEDVENFSSVLEILKKQIKSLDNSENEEDESEFIEFWAPTFVISIEELRKSYKDYEIWLLENEDEEKRQDEILKRLNLNSRKLFFVTFMQQCCHLDDRFRLSTILAILNSEDFAREFGCKKTSRMNPENKCIIKWNKRR